MSKHNRKLNKAKAKQSLEHNQKMILNMQAFATIQERILNVAPLVLAAREQRLIEQKHKEQNQNSFEIAGIVELFDDEVINASRVYCAKTGKLVFEYPAQTIQDSIRIIGKKKTLYWLQEQRKHFVHPIAIFTDPNSLNELSHSDPISYCVMALNKFHNEQFPIDQLIESRQLLESRNEKQIVYLNELLRRYLGLANPKNGVAIHNFTSMIDIVSNDETINSFIDDLKSSLLATIEKHCKQTKQKLINIQTLNKVHIMEISSRFGGATNFRIQKKIGSNTIEDSFLFDLAEIMLDEEDFEDETKRAKKFAPGRLGFFNDLEELDFAEERESVTINERSMDTFLASNPSVPLHLQSKKADQDKANEKKNLFKNLFKKDKGE